MTYQIESGIRIPSPRSKVSRYPFADMGVGDSFMAPPDESVNTIRTASRNYAKNNPGTQFTVRTVEGGFRCWRIS